MKPCIACPVYRPEEATRLRADSFAMRLPRAKIVLLARRMCALLKREGECGA